MLVEVGENWNQDIEVLQWLAWVDGYDNARVEGRSVRLEVIREVVKMPSLRSLILADAEIRDDALDPLAELKRLDTLEFQYSRLEESHGDLIAALPLRTSLILMGTGLSEQRANRLKEELPGLQIQYRRGGFLGVMCIDNFDVCEVTGIQEGSAAEAAGLMRGDIITMIDDREIKHFRDLQNAINEHVPGDSVEVQYQRGGEEQSLSLKLRRYQES
jgi:membrane-associated protease RseP (regulator of RpoE activity)